MSGRHFTSVLPPMPDSPWRTKHRSGYTLIELLAVVTLMGLITWLFLPALVRRAAGDPLADTIRSLCAFEHHQRGQAVGHGAQLDLEAIGITAVVGNAMASAPDEFRCADDTLLFWRDDHDHALRALDIDCRGRSQDAILLISRKGVDRRLRLQGLTGIWSEMPLDGQTP